MKDLPHHLKKLNRRVIRSMHREELSDETFELPNIPPQKTTTAQMRKKKKAAMRKKTLSRTPVPMTPEERNKKMKKRVPIFDRLNHPRPKRTRTTKKKTPRK